MRVSISPNHPLIMQQLLHYFYITVCIFSRILAQANLSPFEKPHSCGFSSYSNNFPQRRDRAQGHISPKADGCALRRGNARFLRFPAISAKAALRRFRSGYGQPPHKDTLRNGEKDHLSGFTELIKRVLCHAYHLRQMTVSALSATIYHAFLAFARSAAANAL